ncbi:MAG: hypothetical protein NTX58_13180 [Actinobacteria bacterium]|nr:hypothetical protein [Actinomycetota bacterium]
MPDMPSKKELRKGPDDHGFQLNMRAVVGGIIAVALVAFIAGNSDTTEVKFLFFRCRFGLS